MDGNEQGHEQGQGQQDAGLHAIEFYDKDGAYMGHAEIPDVYIGHVVEAVSVDSGALAVASGDDLGLQVDALNTLPPMVLVNMVMTFALFGAVCVLTLVRSLRVK